MNSVLILLFCSAAAIAQNAPVAPYSLDYYGVPWKSGNYEVNIMKRAIVQWNGADEYEKVDRYMTEVAMVYQNILYGYLDMPFEMRNTTAYVSFKGEKTKNDITLYKYNVDMYSHDGDHWRQRRMVLDSSFFVVRYFKRPDQDQTESTTGGDYWETTTTTTTGGDYWETTTTPARFVRMETTSDDYNWETSSDSYDNWETASDFYDAWYDNWDWETSSDSYGNYDFGTTDEPMMG